MLYTVNGPGGDDAVNNLVEWAKVKVLEFLEVVP